ncbi:MAG: hypothetical protein ABI830_14855, partial [Pseudolabrys sp.]
MDTGKEFEQAKIEQAKIASAKIEVAKRELPIVEAPSISPAISAEPAEKIEPKVEPEVAAKIEPATAPVVDAATAAAEPAPASILSFAKSIPNSLPKLPSLRPRHKRYALLAASITIAAALGAVTGVTIGGGINAPVKQVDSAAVNERQAMAQTLAKLNKEIGTLKTNLDTAKKTAHSEIAKITERVERQANADRQASAELITGSISAPQTTTAVIAPVLAPMPTPRPAPRIAAVESQTSAAPPIVAGWSVRDVRDGFVYVQGNGEIYQVVPGAPLPGLGPVESVKRRDGRWVVTTPKGIIVSMRDRRYE